MNKRIQPFSFHLHQCSTCVLCELGARSADRVYYRWGPDDFDPSEKNVDILFIGEAPGQVEAACSKPFMGPFGKILQEAIDRCQARYKFTYLITNSVICTPYTDNSLSEISKPYEDHIRQCRPRLDNLIDLVNPLFIITLGQVPKKAMNLKGFDKHEIIELVHPAFILRKGGTNGVEFKRFYLQMLEIAERAGSTNGS